MECRDEQERQENGNLSRDVPFVNPEWFAIQALIDHRLQQKEQTDE